MYIHIHTHTHVQLDKLANFSWDDLASELKIKAPVLHAFLTTCVDVKRRRRTVKTTRTTSSAAVMGVCASILPRHKNQHMNILQHIVSLILHRGHAGKQVNVACAYVQTLLPIITYYRLIAGYRNSCYACPANEQTSFGFTWQGL